MPVKKSKKKSKFTEFAADYVVRKVGKSVDEHYVTPKKATKIDEVPDMAPWGPKDKKTRIGNYEPRSNSTPGVGR